jgi:hypothetical protein
VIQHAEAMERLHEADEADVAERVRDEDRHTAPARTTISIPRLTMIRASSRTSMP